MFGIPLRFWFSCSLALALSYSGGFSLALPVAKAQTDTPTITPSPTATPADFDLLPTEEVGENSRECPADPEFDTTDLDPVWALVCAPCLPEGDNPTSTPGGIVQLPTLAGGTIAPPGFATFTPAPATSTPTPSISPSPTNTLTPTITPTPGLPYWAQSFDFTTSSYEPVVSAVPMINGESALYVPGSGWRYLDGLDVDDASGQYYRGTNIFFEFPYDGGSITDITVLFDYEYGSLASGGIGLYMYYVSNSYTVSYGHENFTDGFNTLHEQTVYRGGLPSTYAGTIFQMILRSSADRIESGEEVQTYSGYTNIVGVIFEGYGVNPFTGGNEPTATPTATLTPSITPTFDPFAVSTPERPITGLVIVDCREPKYVEKDRAVDIDITPIDSNCYRIFPYVNIDTGVLGYGTIEAAPVDLCLTYYLPTLTILGIPIDLASLVSVGIALFLFRWALFG